MNAIVIVRTYSAGVHVGTLHSREGRDGSDGCGDGSGCGDGDGDGDGYGG